MAEIKPAKRPRPTRKKKHNMSEEGRQKLSELAKQRHAEGKLGGKEFGRLGGRGNTREKRLAAADLAEAIRTPEMVEAMKKTLIDSQDPDRPFKQRLDGMKLAMEIERENAKFELSKERAEGEKLDRATLIKLLAGKLSNGPVAPMIRAQLETESIADADVIEGEVVDGD